MMSKPKIPKAPPIAPPAMVTGETAMNNSTFSRMRKRMASMFGRQSTILTSGMGANSTRAPQKTLLGA